jgi:hypothetical protein
VILDFSSASTPADLTCSAKMKKDIFSIVHVLGASPQTGA